MKKYERHPLSADNDDITGQDFEDMVAGVKRCGIVGRKITLHEGKILDGWQLYRACKQAGVEPEFEDLPEGITPEDLDHIRNDLRRHNEAEAKQRRRAKRIERIAAARQEGKSLRTIAEEEKVSVPQVRRDLEEGTVPGGGTVKPKDGKVTGKDGREQPATKLAKPEILCDRCARVGKVRDCSKCAEEKARSKAKPAPKPKAGKPVFDDRPFDKLYGDLVRFFDKRKSAYGHGAKDKVKGHEECLESMGLVYAAWTRWQKATT